MPIQIDPGEVEEQPDIAAAIRGLSDADLTRLRALAGLRARTLPGIDWSDLLNEAIVRAFGRPEDNAHGAGFDEQLDQLLAFGAYVRKCLFVHLTSSVASERDEATLSQRLAVARVKLVTGITIDELDTIPREKPGQ